MNNHLTALLSLLISFNFFTSYSQYYTAPAAFAWANKYGSSPYDDETYDMAVDGSGNIITVGKLDGTSTFGTHTIMASNECFVAKTSPSGQALWAKHIPKSMYLKGVTTDAAGNIYVTGVIHEYGNYTFGSSTINFPELGSGFIGKIDPNGNFLWAKAFTGEGTERVNSVAVDASGNIYVTGFYNRIMTIGSLTLNGPYYSDYEAFVCKLNSSGDALWAKGLAGYNLFDSYGTKIAVNSAGDVYAAGYYYGTFNFNNTASYGSQDLYLTKFNASGTQQWLKHYGGSSYELLGDMHLDNSGNIFMAGSFTGTANFETNTFMSGGAENIVYFKTDPSGNVLWAKHLSGNGSQDIAQSITTDAAGNVYLGLTFGYTLNGLLGGYSSFGEEDGMIVKANSTGTPVWAYQFGGNFEERAVGVHANAAGEVFCAGDFSSPLGDWDYILQPYSGYRDLTVFKLKTCANINASIVQTGNTLGVTPALPGAQYIWQTCDGSYTYQGETASTFSPMAEATYRVWINNAGCVTRTACKMYTISSVGLDELSVSFQLYPNPANEDLVLSFEETVSLSDLKMVTLTGQVVKTFADWSTKEQVLDLSGISNGTYLLEGKVNGQSFVRQIVKE